VDDYFDDCFGSNTAAGFHDRFLFGLSPKPFSYTYRPFEGLVETTEPCCVTIAREVWEAVDDWKKQISGLGRCADHAIRAAVVAAAFDGRTVLQVRDLKPARALAEYEARVRHTLSPNVGDGPDARCAEKIRRALETQSKGMTKSELYDKIHAERLGPSVFDRCTKAMLANGQIVSNGKIIRTGGS
jgi:hypothetical protein